MPARFSSQNNAGQPQLAPVSGARLIDLAVKTMRANRNDNERGRCEGHDLAVKTMRANRNDGQVLDLGGADLGLEPNQALEISSLV